ncbi:putative elongation factor tu gtp binding domain-containing protein [Diaporthe ampelina]|uniref:Elongation factor 1 alpha-like protein n=1 Tax=Diaporthe ampelina TaxID=1214573 RepID=A0A0G2HE45_9PEZI|nr:putative elongation factor tu gtp binding domain-containing protein [Diaporthe ampelina]
MYQNYDYENDLDEFDGNELAEEEELSAEDKAQMAAATAEVKSMLGPQASKVTIEQIQESLWHYYYDVDKTVAYLISKYIDPAPKPAAKTKVPKTMPQASDGASEADPWRALAAARKKKQEEKKSETPQEGTARNDAPETEVLRAKVSKMDIRHEKAPQNQTTAAPSAPSECLPGPAPALDGTVDSQDHAPVVEKVQPSTFAQALFKSASETPQPHQQLYAPPWLAFTTDEALVEAFSKPSPDDVVQAAQSQGKKLTSNTPITKNKDAAEAAKNLKELKIAETPLPKSKNLNVLKEYEKSERKRSASFVVVGHVDSGKSTMTGRLLLDLGEVDQRTIDKYRKEAEKEGKSSFALAWVLDTRTEERSRGVTIDIATKNFETESTLFTIVDSPGHKDYVPNMIAGASQADFAVLVVDAAKGAFEAGLKGQTREHALLLRSMGVFRLIVAVNKLDTSQWSQDRFDEIKDQIMGSLKALKFPDKNISFVPVSGLNGDNVVKRSQDPAASWYKGPTLIEELELSEPAARPLDKPLRMTISDLWDTRLSPITVAGRLEAGSLQVGDALLVQPSGEKAYVKALELNGEPVDWAVAGQHVVIYLSHVDEEHIRIGDVICPPSAAVSCVDTFTMKALAFDTFFPMPVDIHKGRLHVPGKIYQLRAVLDIHTGAIIKKTPQIVKAGSVARIRMKTDDKVPLEKGERVVIRYNGETVAAGLLEETQ